MVSVHVEARRATCIGSGQCVFAAPDTFDQDDDGWVVVLNDEPVSPAELAAARQAVQICPSRSLSLVEE
ncbi:MAG: ferredoxin [Protaetiibacter sp.]